MAELPPTLRPRSRLACDHSEVICGHSDAVFPALLELRHQLLRPGRPREECLFPGDAAEHSRHYGAFVSSHLVAIASLLRNPCPHAPAQTALQLRGMATLPEFRGQGIASELLRLCVEDAETQGVERIWCNARRDAVGLYRRQGFSEVGEEFDIPGIGPHRLMWRDMSG